MSQVIRGLFIYLALATPLSVLIFLLASSFFTSWDGSAVAVLPFPPDDKPSVHKVIIVEKDRSTFESRWPAASVEGLNLPVSNYAPSRKPDIVTSTVKKPYTLTFSVQKGEISRTVPTTSPHGFFLALAGLLLGLGIRNAFVSGSMFDMRKRDKTDLPKALAPAGQPAPRRRVSQKGPPQSKGKRGRRRR